MTPMFHIERGLAAGFVLVALCLSAMSIGLAGDRLTEALPGSGGYDQGDNGLWMRRHWLHEGPTSQEIEALVASLRAHGVKRIYPFLGPMDGEGWPGWRSKSGFRRYDLARAAAFIAAFHRLAPEIRILPWTGGILDKDVNLKDAAQQAAFAEHARRLVEAGADGIHVNIEPVKSGASDYLRFLRAVKAAIGERVLSVAAFPPPIPGEEDDEMHWTLSYLREVCGTADEIAVMAYNTGRTTAQAFESLIAGWTKDIATALPERGGGGCEWLMGVPAYDDEEPYHRPDVETVEHSLNGIVAGLHAANRHDRFRGVAIYASFSAGERHWAMYERLWRGKKPESLPPLDPRNTTE